MQEQNEPITYFGVGFGNRCDDLAMRSDGILIFGKHIPWLWVIIIVVAIGAYILNKRGFFQNIDFGSVGTSVNTQPSFAPVGISANLTESLQPSLPSGDVAKMFHHDTW